MNEVERIIEAINNVGKTTSFDWLNFGLNLILTIIATWIAYVNFKLQKKMKEDEDKEKKLEAQKHISSVYYFLNDILHKMADTNFKYDTFNNVVVDGAKYMDDINYIRMQGISEDDFNYLRELYALYDGIKADSRENMKNFKVLYKKVIDVYINPKNIPEHKSNNNYDYLASIQLLTLMKKLEYMMGGKIKNSAANIKLDFHNKVYIRKDYDEKHYVENKNGIINGNVMKYETIMTFDHSNISTASELIYEGEITNGIIEGAGKYNYYTKIKGFDRGVNSRDLKEEGINLDIIAQRIKDIMSFECADGMFIATFEGTFKNGNIDKGILRYKLNPNEQEQEKEVN